MLLACVAADDERPCSASAHDQCAPMASRVLSTVRATADEASTMRRCARSLAVATGSSSVLMPSNASACASRQLDPARYMCKGPGTVACREQAVDLIAHGPAPLCTSPSFPGVADTGYVPGGDNWCQPHIQWQYTVARALHWQASSLL